MLDVIMVFNTILKFSIFRIIGAVAPVNSKMAFLVPTIRGNIILVCFYAGYPIFGPLISGVGYPRALDEPFL